MARAGEGVPELADEGTRGGDSADGVLPKARHPPRSAVSGIHLAKASTDRPFSERVDEIRGVMLPFVPDSADASYADSAAQTRRIEMQRRHAQELFNKTMEAVQDLEWRL